MSKVLVTETAIRSLISELLKSDAMPAISNELPYQAPITANPELDTTYRVFNGTYEIPVGFEIVPHDKRELAAIIKSFLVDVPDTAVGDIYAKMKVLFDEIESGADEMGKNSTVDFNSVFEATIRKHIRKLLEAPEMKSALNFSGFDFGSDDGDEAPLKRKRDINIADTSDPTRKTYAQVQGRKEKLKNDLPNMSPEERAEAEAELASLDLEDPREMSHDEMLPYLGHAGVTGVKSEEFKTIQKANFLANMDPKERADLIDTARDEYVTFLADGGDLDPEEVELLKKSPEAVEELEGFRDWLDAYIWEALEDEDPVHYIPGEKYDAIRADKLAKGIEPAWPKGPKGEPVHKRGDWADKQRSKAARSVQDREKERNKEKKAAAKEK